MDIHHAMIVRSRPERLYEALTRAEDLSVWMAAPVVIEPPGPAEVGSVIEFRYEAHRQLRVAVTGLEAGRSVRWQVTQPIWFPAPVNAAQAITWTLSPYESSTLVDFRMGGWEAEDDAYASVSYKWASFMMRLKIYAGDVREIADLLERIEARVREK